MKISLSIAIALLAGCASAREVCREHPLMCASVGASLALCAHGALHTGRRDGHIPTPSVDCTNGDVCR